MKQPTPEMIAQLEEEKNIWLATVRPDGKPHLVPVWFIWDEDTFYICIFSKTVKFINISQYPLVFVSLENGTNPVICEGNAERMARPWPGKVVKAFKDKYDWDIETDKDYDEVVRILPRKWLNW